MSITTIWQAANEAYSSVGLTRKYTGEPYIVHPAEVARIILEAGILFTELSDDHLTAIIDAALLHDVLEDVYPKKPEYSIDWIEKISSPLTATIVLELTNHYTSSAYPEMNRYMRKHLENVRLSSISNGGLLIKLADVISNTRVLAKHDPVFAKTYFLEKSEFLNLIEGRIYANSSKDNILRKLFNQARENVSSKR